MQNIVGNNIRQRRLELGLTQDELAKKLGLRNRVSVSTVENGKEDLTTERVRQFAKALNCSPADLMGWDDMSLRMITYAELIMQAYQKASTKDKKAVCAILDVPFEE